MIQQLSLKVIKWLVNCLQTALLKKLSCTRTCFVCCFVVNVYIKLKSIDCTTTITTDNNIKVYINEKISNDVTSSDTKLSTCFIAIIITLFTFFLMKRINI